MYLTQKNSWLEVLLSELTYLQQKTSWFEVILSEIAYLEQKTSWFEVILSALTYLQQKTSWFEVLRSEMPTSKWRKGNRRVPKSEFCQGPICYDKNSIHHHIWIFDRLQFNLVIVFLFSFLTKALSRKGSWAKLVLGQTPLC